MIRLQILRTASFSVFFQLVAVALVHTQALPAPTEAPSPLFAIVHDFTTWLDHVGATGAHPPRVGSHSPPLPRPRPAERASAVLASNQGPSEFAPAPVAPKKKTSTLVQIRD